MVRQLFEDVVFQTIENYGLVSVYINKQKLKNNVNQGQSLTLYYEDEFVSLRYLWFSNTPIKWSLSCDSNTLNHK